MESTSATAAPVVATNSKARVLFASLVGTTIEFFDFYIYATAAVIIFPHLFFPASSGSAAVLQSLATFAIAFIARPIGAALFGHLGDRIGRKATLVAALLTMGISTVCIGLLPTYAQIGIVAPLLLAACRLGQGLGLGGEWSGAVLLATENAPEGKRAWYGMFPQLGAPIGFILATGSFLLLSAAIPEQAFMQWAGVFHLLRVQFWSLLVYIRLKLHETPAFQKVLDKQKEVNIPFKEVVTKHTGKLILGTIAAICTFVVFYLTTVFALNWGTTKLGYARGEFLELQLFATLCFAAFIPLSAIFAEKFGRKATSVGVCIAAAIFGLFFSSMLESGNTLIVFFSYVLAYQLWV
ncbi:MFS transporter [Acinetobacter seifertii]|nr:MFS transporter [Acinetobacter seifertii]